MHTEEPQTTTDLSHLAANLLNVEGIAALALVYIHQLAARVFHSSWRCVDSYKDTHVKVHAQGHHGNDMPLISVRMPLQQ